MNFFSLKLMAYLIEQHPHMVTDTEFVSARGEEAALEFANCSKSGMSADESMSEALRTLYQGLHFSVYAAIKDCLEEKVTDADESALSSAALEIMRSYSRQLSRYETGDDNFAGSSEYPAFCRDVECFVERYKVEYGI